LGGFMSPAAGAIGFLMWPMTPLQQKAKSWSGWPPRLAGRLALLRWPGSTRRGFAEPPDRLISNARIKVELGWRPEYPSFREGYRQILSGLAS